ncbi:MAG: zf-HC2 domain-containing protein [Kofleriaceae bacterium]
MSLCESIDTLAMAYLDDELANEERRELDTHLHDCDACRAEVAEARADQALIQTSLVAPRMTDTMRLRLIRSLDEDDKVTSIATRKRRFSQLALPGVAIAAAAAAIFVFVGVNMKPSQQGTSVEQAAVRQQTRALPLEVQGPRTGDWVRQYAAVAPPDLKTPGGSQLLGARMLPGGINGHDGTLLSYDITVGGRHVVLSLLVIQDIRPEEMQDGDEVDTGGRTVRVIQSNGHNAVTVTDAGHRGYMFMADELPVSDLIALVGRTSLVGPQ